jgi:hypothetical protein
LSSVIFGSSIPDHFFTSRNEIQYSSVFASKQATYELGFGMNTKYSINYIDAKFKSQHTKYPSPEHKVFKSKKNLKKEVSFK